MDATLQLVERFEELVQREHDQSPYDFKSIFATGGFFVRRASQQKLRLLQRLDESLRAVLRPGERVVYLTTGVLYSFWESYFFGWAVRAINRRALILTTERLVLVQIDSRRRPRALRSQILLADIARLTRTPLGSAKLTLASGASYVFVYVPKRDRRTLADLIEKLRPAATRTSAAHGLEQLCPYCYAPVPGHPPACPVCGGRFKSPAKAALLSFLIPGLGTAYVGYWGFGIFKAVVVAFLWIGILSPDGGAPVALVGVAIVMGFVHGLAALTSWYLARRGHHPGAAPEPVRRPVPTA